MLTSDQSSLDWCDFPSNAIWVSDCVVFHGFAVVVVGSDGNTSANISVPKLRLISKHVGLENDFVSVV